MAGGGAHWWNYEVHYDDTGEEQLEMYINNINGRHYQADMRLFVLDSHLRMEHEKFCEGEWILMSSI